MKNKHRRAKLRFFIVSGIIALTICGALLMLSKYISGKREPLTPNQILEKKDWTKDELADAITRLELQRNAHKGKASKEVYAHLRDKMEKLPEKDRDEVIVKTISGSISKGLELIRAMEPDKRKSLMAEMKKEAERNRKTSESLTREEKKELKSQMKDVYMKAVDNTMVNLATPEERKEMAPIVKEWVATLENLE